MIRKTRVRGGALVIAAIAGLVAFAAFAAPACAFVYWGYSNSDGTGGIGRANNDGSDVIATFIPAASNVGGIAVNGRYIYWASGGANEIGRANIDGTQVDPNFMTSANNPSGVAVNGHYIYWSNYYGQSIGRANIDGTNPVENFITTAQANPIGVSVDGSYLYWGYGPVNSYNADVVGRANLDGTGQTTFLEHDPVPGWSNDRGWQLPVLDGEKQRVWRRRDRTRDARWLGPDQHVHHRGKRPPGSRGCRWKIFWGNDTFTGPGTIGVANLDGTDVNQDFVSTGRPVVWSVAADTLSPTSTTGAGSPPPPELQVSAITTTAEGTTNLSVGAPVPGEIDVLETAWIDNLDHAYQRLAGTSANVLLQPASGRFVFARSSAPVSQAGRIPITVTSNPTGALLIEHHRYRVTIRLWITYTPTGGSPERSATTTLTSTGLALPEQWRTPVDDSKRNARQEPDLAP